ncbi:TetR/AcrR family transcriptional regulator [Persicobacter sp. CCB-QB2]|uniref:TetR/AcrR family transcriptional regulator n=1 Tax=Persicobacter sp. CCB-QB2 TaxID=1561025 RepID=UPI0006A98B79|nr:TetR/AcrR family transcriptional regulator [Persicobacter sp. CCB-QB2]
MRTKDEGKINRIYQATVDLVMQVGIAGATIPKIAKKAGMASGTLYIYFENKEDLLRQLYLHLKSEMVSVTFGALDKSAPFKLQMFQLWKELLAMAVEKYPERIFLEQYKISPFYDEQVMEASIGWVKQAEDFLEEGKNQLLVKDIQKDLVYSMMYGFLNELAVQHRRGLFHLNDHRIGDSFGLLWDAIKA